MKTILLWVALLLGVAAQQDNTASAKFNHDPRTVWRDHGIQNVENPNIGELVADKLNNGYNELDKLLDFYIMDQQQMEQNEVFGIVEPLIEDTPCANRPCSANNDCCPTGVCVNTYGEGKCVYAYGRKRDLCQRNADCGAGNVCAFNIGEKIWKCKATKLMQQVLGLEQPLANECNVSRDCQLANGFCCMRQQSQWLRCAYFLSPFECIDMGKAGSDDILAVWKHRRNTAAVKI